MWMAHNVVSICIRIGLLRFRLLIFKTFGLYKVLGFSPIDLSLACKHLGCENEPTILRSNRDNI